MTTVEQLTTVEETLTGLIKEHKKILIELTVLEELIPEDSSFPTKALSVFRNIKNLLLTGHHKREDTILYEWMLNQNKTVDHDIIDRIRKDHEDLEMLLESINQQAEKFSPASSANAAKFLAHELSNFIDLYREHVCLEEKFIFQIAKGIIAARKRF